MRPVEQRNRLTPEYFYPEVAKKFGVPVELVRDIYTKYLSKIVATAKEDNKVFIKGLGSFERDPKKLIGQLHKFDRIYEKVPQEFENDELEPRFFSLINTTSRYYKQLLEIKKKYEFVERYIQDIRANNGGVEKLFDNEGNCRRSFSKKNIHLQELPIQLEECEDISGVLREGGSPLQVNED